MVPPRSFTSRPSVSRPPAANLCPAPSRRSRGVRRTRTPCPLTRPFRASGGAMPKIVDHDARRQEIAEAVTRVVARDGVAGVTMKAVASETGWSTGAVTHYFAYKDHLLAVAGENVLRGIVERAEKAAVNPDVRVALYEALGAAMPLTSRGLARARATISYLGRAVADERLARA